MQHLKRRFCRLSINKLIKHLFAGYSAKPGSSSVTHLYVSAYCSNPKTGSISKTQIQNKNLEQAMEYNFREIEKKWQQRWKDTNAYKVSNDSDKPKYYVLDMFPYPSGAGLHVGHPLGYIASDIFARFKRLKGFNVLHPMGYDAFGLPAEQYAIEHGIHPAVSTAQNIHNFRNQLDNIGFCFDWDRQVNTSEPGYYKWTQWIFLQLFKSFYNKQTNKAESIDVLVASFEKEGNSVHPFPASANYQPATFTAEEWHAFSETQQQDILMNYRLAYCGYGEVNWCEALGTVLANDEVVNGVSERGGYPVVKKKLRQWYLRITEYADRLLQGLQTVDFSDAMKEMQGNWIGKSSGAEIVFPLSISPRRGEEVEETETNEKEKLPGFGYASYEISNMLNFENAKQMRKEPTEAENVLWNALRNKNIGYKFRRQHPIENYIIDFVCLDVWLIVEVDGGYHTDKEQAILDETRDEALAQIGFKTLRFTNQEVLSNIDNVLNKIKQVCDERKNTSHEKISQQSSKPVSAGSSPLQGEAGVRVYTTRPDTIFGVDFMVVAPELDWIDSVVSPDQKEEVDNYIAYVKSRSDRERQAEKKITGCFTGAYAVNPFNGKQIPIWISEYVLAGYGTGAIMAVPCGDERDFKFAKHFNIPITNIIGSHFNGEEANPTKDAVLENSGFLNGIPMRKAIDIVGDKIEEMGIGKRKTNFRMRDAAFSRQRYWGEPFPIKWIDGIAYPLDESELPLELPHVDSYKPGPDGEGPLANIDSWTAAHLETNTMPGYAGSSWYFLRYMDPHNNTAFCDRKASDYWGQVDLYIGGTEHAVGHLLYSRMWTKVLYDLGHIGHDEPYKRLVNQGMIQGSSRFVYRKRGTNTFISYNLIKDFDTVDPIHVDVNFVDGVEMNVEAFKSWRNGEYADAEFELEDGKYICGSETEKMSKRYFNVVNPDDIVSKYGADTYRMYEMFLGPVEQSKPWDTKGIEGVHRFLRKLWRLFFDEVKGKVWTDAKATDAELKILHKAIKKIEEDTERFSFNTAVSAFMVCVNDLADAKCNKKEVLEQLLIMLVPYAPHVTEELWAALGNTGSILDAAYPVYNPAYLVESAKEYPVSVNGKLRTTITLPLDMPKEQVEETVVQNEIIKKWLEGKAPKKIIFVQGKMVNVVI